MPHAQHGRGETHRVVPAGALTDGPVPDERYRSLFEEHPHAVFGLDRDGRLTDVNAAAGRISGFSAEQLLRMSFEDLIDAGDLDRASIAFALVLDRVPQQIDLRIGRHDGTLADL